ncbi:hypothetical protein ACM614_29310, partial [Streptomyces sp. 12297]
MAGIRTEFGDLAEVCVDLSPASRWRLAAYRMKVVQQARARARREAAREARALDAESTTSLPAMLGGFLSPGAGRAPVVVPPRPRLVDR